MSKRCCAKNCFNSVLYNRNIAYFSFPKNKEFAQRWAELAGRNDLKEKPLSRIIKYFLCSEHFAANCFVDKDTRQTLKRNLPHSIALPSIFKNNLQETMQNANPKHSIEVHNIILLDVDEKINDSYCSPKQLVVDESISESLCCSQKSSPVKDEFFTNDDLDIQRMDVCLQSVDTNIVEETAILLPLHNEISPVKCRLCFKELMRDEQRMQLGESLHLKEFIGRVMPNKISIGDKMSQVVCKNCENNALLCLIIIQQMDAAQEKMTQPDNK